MTRVVTLGEAMGLLRTTETGTLAHLGTVAVGVGGAEANVAIGLVRLGIPASWLGRIGADSLGRRVIRELRGEGVEVHAIVDDAAPTGLMLKETPVPGRTVVRFYRAAAAGSRLGPQDLGPLDITDADLVHLTGILPALSPSAAAASEAALLLARRAGVDVSFDVNHRASLWSAEEAAPAYRRMAASAQYVFGGIEELEMLVGAHPDDRSLAEAVAALGAREVVVKRGADGAAALVDGVWSEVPAYRVSVVDSVGAGDAFVAGYLAARLRAQTVETALRNGARTGSAACQSPGDWEGALYQDELTAPLPTDAVAR